MTLFDKSGLSAAGAALLAIAIGAPAAALSDSALPLMRPVQVASAAYLQVIQSLKAQGYAIERVSRTFLGRYQILARNPTQLREVIVSSSTGEIKRDAVIKRFESGGADTGASNAQHAGPSSGSGATGVATGVGASGVSVGASLGAAGGASGEAASGSGGAASSRDGAGGLGGL
ncbi:hypothetical protein [Thioclava atlantica]|nr:hypothetical protein [Thioclava atlantica]